MLMFEQAGQAVSQNKLSDWMLRGSVAFLFVIEGADKFSDGWVKLFQEIGFGQWFRYATGIIEVIGGILVLIPRTTQYGLVLLACTMASAAALLTVVVGRPADAVFSFVLLIALGVFWWSRNNQ